MNWQTNDKTASAHSRGISFVVDDVVPAGKRMLEGRLSESFAALMSDQHALFVQDGEAAVLSGPTPSKNALIAAVHHAFSDHRPLALSPDAIWLTIAQGFAHHVRENTEALRSRIVRHEGRMKLNGDLQSLRPDDWVHLIRDFSSGVRRNSDAVLYETLMCEFSTTTPHLRTVLEIALMDVYEGYFRYVALMICGIPRITLEGTAQDWRRIRERIDVLGTYDLRWWTDRLAPILDEFVATAEGRPNLAFWQAIYQPKTTYGSGLTTGWISDLFPYLGEASKRVRNVTLKIQRKDWILPNSEGAHFDVWSKGQSPTGIDLRQFPAGVSQAAVEVQTSLRESQEINVIGGFAGVEQRVDGTLSPKISWAIAKQKSSEEMKLL